MPASQAVDYFNIVTKFPFFSDTLYLNFKENLSPLKVQGTFFLELCKFTEQFLKIKQFELFNFKTGDWVNNITLILIFIITFGKYIYKYTKLGTFIFIVRHEWTST